MRRMSGLIVSSCLLVAASAFADLALEFGKYKNRPDDAPRGLSGITHAGGDDYYVVADNGAECGLYRATIALAADGLSIASCSVGERIPLNGMGDLEGVAHDPASGNLWVADEGLGAILEFAPTGGAALQRLELPPVMMRNVSNYGLESLTISGDGLTMWTANEEALTVDGERSSPSAGTTVRLVKFTRRTIRSKWELAAMYAYTTDKWHYPKAYGNNSRRGVSDLCALPDGSLLVLERELSSKDGSALGADFFFSIYQVTPAALAQATDVQSLTDGLRVASDWKAVEKVHLFSAWPGEHKTFWSNVEGLCLGPRLAEGKCGILTLTDSGDGKTDSVFIPLVLSGLDVRTLDFGTPALGRATVEGSNYRFLTGDRVSVALFGDGIDPVSYTNNGAMRATSVQWRLPAHSPSEGEGTSMSFVVSNDDKLTWNIQSEVAETPVLAADSFERQPVGTEATALDGWRGAGVTIAADYSPATPPGHPMQRETHTRVLKVWDSAERECPAVASTTRQQVDMMVQVVRLEEWPTTDDVGQGTIVASPEGRLVFGRVGEDGLVGWTTLSPRIFQEGEWVRIAVDFDYAASVPTCSVWIDGQPCGTLALKGGKRSLEKIEFEGDVALDDLLLTKGEPAFEIASASALAVQVPSTWYARYGLALNPDLDVDGDGLVAWQEYLAGSSPTDASSVFSIRGFSVENGIAVVRFSGDLPDVSRLVVECSGSLSAGWRPLAAASVSREGDEYVWRGSPGDADGAFFRAFIRN